MQQTDYSVVELQTSVLEYYATEHNIHGRPGHGGLENLLYCELIRPVETQHRAVRSKSEQGRLMMQTTRERRQVVPE